MTTPPDLPPEEGSEGNDEPGSIDYEELTPGQKLDIKLEELRDTLTEIMDTLGEYASAVVDEVQAKASAVSAAIDEVQARAAEFSAAIDAAQGDSENPKADGTAVLDFGPSAMWSWYRCKAGGSWVSGDLWGHPLGGIPLTLVPAYAALEQALTASGYGPPSEGDIAWAYVCRYIAGTNERSLHSYGVAVDIDWTHNPYSGGDPYSGWVKEEHVDAVMAIRTLGGRRLWFWGGYWSPADRMHFQLDVSPYDCKPDWDTVKEVYVPLSSSDKAWIRGAVREEVDASIDAMLEKDDDQTSRLSRNVLQHGGLFSTDAKKDDNLQKTVVRIDQNTK